ISTPSFTMNVFSRHRSAPVPSQNTPPGTDNVNDVNAVATGSGETVGAGCGPDAANVATATTNTNAATHATAAPPRNARLRRVRREGPNPFLGATLTAPASHVPRSLGVFSFRSTGRRRCATSPTPSVQTPNRRRWGQRDRPQRRQFDRVADASGALADAS